GMLLLQGFSGLSAIFSYRHHINELDHAHNKSPHRKEIILALAAVFEPLAFQTLKTPEWLAVHQREVWRRLNVVHEEIEDYHRRLDAELIPHEQRLPIEQMLHRLDTQLVMLRDEQVPR